jgi:hypothetical protein
MALGKPVVFRYKLAAGRLPPMVSAGVQFGSTWQPLELYLDSGATYTILRPKVAQDLGFDWTRGRKVFVQIGDGSRIPIYLHELAMQIGPVRFKATIGFSDKLGVGFHLLGRQDVFEHFKICFHEKRKLVSFQAVR